MTWHIINTREVSDPIYVSVFTSSPAAFPVVSGTAVESALCAHHYATSHYNSEFDLLLPGTFIFCLIPILCKQLIMYNIIIWSFSNINMNLCLLKSALCSTWLLFPLLNSQSLHFDFAAIVKCEHFECMNVECFQLHKDNLNIQMLCLKHHFFKLLICMTLKSLHIILQLLL